MYKENLQYIRKFQGGFSLIELILVIVLIGIFSTIAMTRTNTSLSVIRENIALDQITSDIDLVKSMAFAQNQTITLSFDVLDESYSVFNEQGIAPELSRWSFCFSSICFFPSKNRFGKQLILHQEKLKLTCLYQAPFLHVEEHHIQKILVMGQIFLQPECHHTQ